MEEHPLNQSSWSRTKQDTIQLLHSGRFWVATVIMEAALMVAAYFLTPDGSSGLTHTVIQAVTFALGMFAMVGLAFVFSLIVAPYRQRNEARNMLERLLCTRFYLKFDGYDETLLSLPPAPFKGSLSFNLTISNQENIPRSVSKFMLEIELGNGDKKELSPIEPDGVTKADITLYLRPHEVKTVRLNFVYEAKPIDEGRKLYVFDDLGAWCRVPINVDTMVTMAKKSTSRSGDYQPL